MKNIVNKTGAIALLTLAAFSSAPAFAKSAKNTATEFTADTKTSSVEWFATKLTGKHNGTVALASGALMVDAKGNPASAKAEVDVAALAVSDIPKDNEYNGKLVGHLNSEDFFNTAKFPKAQLEVTKFAKLAKADSEGNTHSATGTLTIKGITKPITFPAMVKIEGAQGNLTATMTVDRTQYDIKYNSGKFFPNIGDKMIHDTFKIVAKISAAKK